MDFVHEIDLIADLTEFVFCVNEDKSVFSSDFASALEQFVSDFFDLFVVFFADKTLTDNFFA